MTKGVWLMLIVTAPLCLPMVGRAQGRAALVRELAEQFSRRLGPRATQESAEVLARKLEGIAARHGDDALRAVSKVGPQGISLLEEAGEHAPQAIRLMDRYGERAVWVASSQNRLGLFANFGDDAAESMLRHGEIAEKLIEGYGRPAAAALRNISGQNARRLAIMADDGTLQRIGRTPELLDVVARFGDEAADFIWRNKGALAVGTALAAFLSNPEAFLRGMADLTEATGRAMTPLTAQAARSVADAARQLPWMWVTGILLGVLGAMVASRRLLRWAGQKLWQQVVVLWGKLAAYRKAS